LFKSLDFAGAGAALPDLDDGEEEEEEEEEDGEGDEDSDDDEEEDDEEADEVLESPSVVVKAVPAKVEKVESKREREDRRIEERELIKVQEKAERAVVREEKSIAKPIIIKSVWVSFQNLTLRND
jgi:ATP-dependent RNA helicase DDX27